MRSSSLTALGLLVALGTARATDLPLFVVERSRVIWPQKCARAGTPVPSELQSRMRRDLGERAVLVGGGRLDPAALGSPECMSGECGSGQFAVPLVGSETERTGLLLPAGKVDAASIRPLKLVSVEGADPHGLRPGLPTLEHPPPACGAPPPETTSGASAASRLVTCLSYLEADGAGGIQVQGRGGLQQNGSPSYEMVRFRVLGARGHGAAPGAWHSQARGKGTRLPVPVALLPGDGPDQVRVLWLREEGICCPSAASAWVTDVGEHALDGPRHVAGFGQPCD